MMTRSLLVALALLVPAGPALAAPTNTSPPSISGSPRVGATLETSNGSWFTPLPIDGYSYQWLRCTPGCGVIPGATTNRYSPVEADRGYRIKSRVTARDATGSSAPADSAAVGPVTGDSSTLAPAPGSGARPANMSPFPTFAMSARRARGGSSLSSIVIRAPARSTLQATCAGRGCPWGSNSYFLRVGRMRIVSLKQRYRAGATIEFRIAHPALVGKYLRVGIGSGGRLSKLDGCLYPGSAEPRGC